MGKEVGIGLACTFAWILGFGATLAEPALFTLAVTVQKLTKGRMSKRQVWAWRGHGIGDGG